MTNVTYHFTDGTKLSKNYDCWTSEEAMRYLAHDFSTNRVESIDFKESDYGVVINLRNVTFAEVR